MLTPVWPVATPFLYHTFPVAALLVNVAVLVPSAQKGCAVPVTVIVGVGGTEFTVMDSTSVKSAEQVPLVAFTVKVVEAVKALMAIGSTPPVPPTTALTEAFDPSNTS